MERRAVHAGHLEIADEEVVRALLEAVQRLDPVPGALYLETGIA